MISLSPKPMTRSRTRITASGAADGVAGAAVAGSGAIVARSIMSMSSIAAALVSHAGKEHREQTVGDDHHKNRFDDRRRHLPAKRLRRALHRKSFDRGDKADDQRHERRFDDADEKRAETDRRLQPREKSLRTDAAIAPGDAHSTEQSGDIGEERQERQADDQRREPR